MPTRKAQAAQKKGGRGTQPPSTRVIEKAMLELLRERGTATACPSEVARKIDPLEWRRWMEEVRRVAARLQKRGTVDVFQHGRRVLLGEARGPLRLRLRDSASVDYRRHSERYRVGRGEEGVLTVEPYKSELLPLWSFATPAAARKSTRALWRRFVQFGQAGDFVGMDMARKFLRMGWTRARRYANHPSGRKYRAGTREELPREEDATKAESAEIFRLTHAKALRHRTYRRLLKQHALLTAKRGSKGLS